MEVPLYTATELKCIKRLQPDMAAACASLRVPSTLTSFASSKEKELRSAAQ